MSWISDVRDELTKLDQSIKSLKKFGILVGSVFSLITLWLFYRDSSSFIKYITGGIGVILILLGIFYPRILKSIHKVWMGLALSMGWIVSRILLTLLFILVTIPIGILTRLLGKDLISHKIEKERTSYWILKTKQDKTHFEKMY